MSKPVVRQGVLYAAPELLIDLCKREDRFRHEVVENRLPEDARLVRAALENGRIALVLESAEFAPVGEGDPLPELPQPWFKCFSDDEVNR